MREYHRYNKYINGFNPPRLEKDSYTKEEVIELVRERERNIVIAILRVWRLRGQNHIINILETIKAAN